MVKLLKKLLHIICDPTIQRYELIKKFNIDLCFKNVFINTYNKLIKIRYL